MRSVIQGLLIILMLGAASQSLANPLQAVPGFWKYWGDGMAEVAVYELTTERYGEARTGYAVSIVVNEPWNLEHNVKSDTNKGPGVISALKLNLIRHFQTGVYDYHTMTSAFSALQAHPQVAPHGALKLTFSAQEWCGQAFQALSFSKSATTSHYHSYFEKSPQGSQSLEPLSSEDHLWLLARNFQGLSIPTRLVRSLYDTRIHHRPLEPLDISHHRDGTRLIVETPRGNYTFTLGPLPFSPLQGWTTPWNEKATLLRSQRLPYWRLNSAEGLDALLDLGLNSASSRLKRSP